MSKSNDGVPVQVKEGKTFLERFTFDDEENYILWNLVQNKNEIEGTENNQAQDLFSNSNNSFHHQLIYCQNIKGRFFSEN